MPTTLPRSVREAPPYSSSPLLAGLNCVDHGFFGARGGVSTGLYCSLNCGHSSRDDRVNVIENRRRVAQCFGLPESALHSLKQAHTTRVVQLNSASPPQFDVMADGMVSNEPGIALGPLGADCAPVLFVDPVNRVIGAAHSGWKGALSGINEAVIGAMLKLGAHSGSIYAAIGPAMQASRYEVQEDFVMQFERVSPIPSASCFSTRNGRLYFDTPGYIRARLEVLGIEKVDQSSKDTFSQDEQFFSYRRSVGNGENDYGRQIAVIALR